MALIKSTVLDPNNQPVIALYIGDGEYGNAQGKTVSGIVWVSMAYATGFKNKGFLSGSELLDFSRSRCFTAVNLSLTLQKDTFFTIKFLSLSDGKEKTLNCRVDENLPDYPTIKLVDRIIAPNEQNPVWTPPNMNNKIQYLQQQMELYMNNEAIQLVP